MDTKQKVVVFTGAGVSADSGIATFRDADGLWANYRIEEVCTPEALARDRKKVVDFYNLRRKELLEKAPNAAHKAIRELEKCFEVWVITQNIDDLHERAGSSHLVHLHGELRKLRSSLNETLTVPLDGWEQSYDAKAPDGSLLRPFVVFFGEGVPQLEKALEIVKQADLFIVVGTSLAVYPAASLVCFVQPGVPIYIVDPHAPELHLPHNEVHYIQERAAIGMPKLVDKLCSDLKK